jgi:hypothetical protein
MKDIKSHSVMQCYKADARIAELEADNAKMRAALEMVEWVWIGTSKQAERTELICPWCKNGPNSIGVEYSSRGHKPDCARQAALAPTLAVADEGKEGEEQ